MKKNISIIACISKNNALGKNNSLLYHLPNDMRMFREMTTGKTVIMGSKTYYSVQKGALPNRENIVVSHSDLDIKDAKVCKSINEAIEASTNDEVFIIGGGQIYKQAMNMADTMYFSLNGEMNGKRHMTRHIQQMKNINIITDLQYGKNKIYSLVYLVVTTKFGGINNDAIYG